MSLIFKELYVERILSGYDWILKFKSDMVKDRIWGLESYITSKDLHWCNIKKFSTRNTIGLLLQVFLTYATKICKYIHIRHYLFEKHPLQGLLQFIRRCSAIRYSMFEFYMIYTCNIQIFFVICYYSWNLKDISYCRHNNKTTILQHWEHVLCTTNAFWIMMESCFLVN